MRAECAAIRSRAEALPSFVMRGQGSNPSCGTANRLNSHELSNVRVPYFPHTKVRGPIVARWFVVKTSLPHWALSRQLFQACCNKSGPRPNSVRSSCSCLKDLHESLFQPPARVREAVLTLSAKSCAESLEIYNLRRDSFGPHRRSQNAGPLDNLIAECSRFVHANAREEYRGTALRE
jgi:hypothetical protein